MKKLFMMLGLMIGVIIVAFFLCKKSIWKNKEVIEEFNAIYNDKKSLDEFCDNHNTYSMEIELKETRVLFRVERDDLNKWSGKLALYSDSNLIEEIPVLIDEGEIIIQTQPEKRISTDILLFKQFETEKCNISEATSQVLFEPSLEEVLGEYPEEDVKIYMQTLYDELISNLKLFDKEEEYFLSIEKLHGFGFNRYTGNSNHICYGLKLAFTGNKKETWNPGCCKFEDVSLILTETTSVAW